jgi:hypothetical protein
MHRTAECKVEEEAKLKCVNCKVNGHASVDRSCPVFLQKMKATHARFPDYQYRFFPTEDPDTWEREDYGVGLGENTEAGNSQRTGQTGGAHTNGTGPGAGTGGNWKPGPQQTRRGTENGRTAGRTQDEGWGGWHRRQGNGGGTEGNGNGSGAGMDGNGGTSQRATAGPLRQTTLIGGQQGQYGRLQNLTYRRDGPDTWGQAPENEEVPEMRQPGSPSISDLYAN